jgi:hypothetical protein
MLSKAERMGSVLVKTVYRPYLAVIRARSSPGGHKGLLMSRDQHALLLRDFGEAVTDIERDVDAEGNLGPESVRLVEDYRLAILWLHGGQTDGTRVREFLELRLRMFDREMKYGEIGTMHNALAAAVETLEVDRSAASSEVPVSIGPECR